MNKIITAECDIWQYLQNCGKKIVMYGMGNGADKILAICQEKNIEISDFFASDGFVRGHSFHGKRVLSFNEIKEKYTDFIVLLSFATSLPDVLEKIDLIGAEAELLVPDVPVFGNTLFDMELCKEHSDDIERTYELFCDDESRRIYSLVINAKLTGKTEYLKQSVSDKNEVFNQILSPKEYTAYADLGAYNGDTIRELSQYAANLKEVYALEPDKKTFNKLAMYAESENRFKISAYNYAAWNKNDILCFDNSGNRNSNVSESFATLSRKKPIEISAIRLDELLCGKKVDYIKYDVEGSEREALSGSEKTIKAYSPDLLVSLYHRSEDIFSLPKFVNDLGKYKLYLRRFRYYPAWDLNLYAIGDV